MKIIRASQIILSCIFITNCGGGGSSTDLTRDISPTPTPAPTPAPTPQPNPDCSTYAFKDDTQYCKWTYDGLDREFYIYVPDYELEQGEYRPLMISLHGGDDFAETNMDYTNFNYHASQKNFYVLYPQGAVAEDKGSTGWNTGYEGYADDIGFISELIDWSAENYNVNLDEVHVAGFSNGGFMSYFLGCNLSSRIATVSVVAGSMESTENCMPEHPTPVIHIHGALDSIISMSGGEYYESVGNVINYWKTFNQCDQLIIGDGINPDYPELGFTWSAQVHTNCLNGADVVFYNMTRLGHEWPNREISIEYDLDAGSQIISFASNFDLGGKKNN